MSIDRLIAHWAIGENTSILRTWRENPPVGSVVKPWAMALYKVLVRDRQGATSRGQHTPDRDYEVQLPDDPCGLRNDRGQFIDTWWTLQPR